MWKRFLKMENKYINLVHLKYDQIDRELFKEKKPIICLSAKTSEFPNDFEILVVDSNNILKAKFNNLGYAKEYAIFLAENKWKKCSINSMNEVKYV